MPVHWAPESRQGRQLVWGLGLGRPHRGTVHVILHCTMYCQHWAPLQLDGLILRKVQLQC